jgi:hypothetical protein
VATEMSSTVESRPGSNASRIRERLSFWSVVERLAPFVLAFGVFLTVFRVMHPETTGDEPHYLLVAESIAYDGDVDLTNDYASRDRTLRVVNVFPLPHDLQAADYTGSGQLRPAHGVGLSAFLAPAVALGGLKGARLAMILVAALLADQLYRLLRDLRLRRRYRIPAWVAAMFCLPVVVFSSQIYPELPGALLVVVALRIMVVGSSSPAALALGSTAAGALVWLHVRYLSLSLAVLLGLFLAACAERRRDEGSVHSRALSERIRAAGTALLRYAATAIKRWRTIVLPIVVPYAVVMGALAIAYQHWYGSPDPRAPYGAFSNTTVGTGGWNFVYDFVLRDLLGPTVGWIPFAPVHWLGFAALGCLVVWFGWRAAACVAAAAAYELVVASAGPVVGWAFPGRYPMIVIPLIAIPIALVIQEIRAARALFVPLLALSLVFVAVAVGDYQGLYPLGEKPRIAVLHTTADAFPNTRPPHLPTSFTLAPPQAPHQTGGVEGNVVVANEGRDGPGYLMWGPYSSLKEGTYRATFPLSVTGVRGRIPVATIEAAGSPPPKLFARRVVTAAELRPRRLAPLTLEFKTPGGYLTETRVYYNGLGSLRAGPVKVEPARLAGSTRVPAWLLTVFWITGTVVVGWLFVRMMKRTRRPLAPGQRQSRPLLADGTGARSGEVAGADAGTASTTN